ncbi:hypothetical protein MVEN_00891100 [Mycena venus]|uniref:Uncharacterized protein n=1 Tax=Mycena venus TaxID=2733690 RepID=A0A8H6YG74_9AGAR|nr:hypothetical protein MVEN_00891100 [Mycena venus]
MVMVQEQMESGDENYRNERKGEKKERERRDSTRSTRSRGEKEGRDRDGHGERDRDRDRHRSSWDRDRDHEYHSDREHRDKDRDRKGKDRARDTDRDSVKSKHRDGETEKEAAGKAVATTAVYTPEFLHALANSPTKAEFDVISGEVRFTRRFVRRNRRLRRALRLSSSRDRTLRGLTRTLAHVSPFPHRQGPKARRETSQTLPPARRVRPSTECIWRGGRCGEAGGGLLYELAGKTVRALVP